MLTLQLEKPMTRVTLKLMTHRGTTLDVGLEPDGQAVPHADGCGEMTIGFDAIPEKPLEIVLQAGNEGRSGCIGVQIYDDDQNILFPGYDVPPTWRSAGRSDAPP